MRKVIWAIVLCISFTFINPAFGQDHYDTAITKAVVDIFKSLKYKNKLYNRRIAVHSFHNAVTKKECVALTIFLSEKVSSKIHLLKDLMDVDFHVVTRRDLEAVETEYTLSNEGIMRENVMTLLESSDILITGSWQNGGDSFFLNMKAEEMIKTKFRELYSRQVVISKYGFQKQVLNCLETGLEKTPVNKSADLIQDGKFRLFDNDIVLDTASGYEWIVGPDKDTTWDEAYAWTRSLTVDGGGWRMPTIEELKILYQKGTGTRNMTPLLKTTGWLIWSIELAGSASAWTLNFFYGIETYESRHSSSQFRAFAVRNRN